MNIDEKTRETLRKKFDLCYLMAQECLSFAKYQSFLELESRHGVDLGTAYRTDVSAKSFTHYIAESQRQQFLSFMCDFLMDFKLMQGILKINLSMM